MTDSFLPLGWRTHQVLTGGRLAGDREEDTEVEAEEYPSEEEEYPP